MEWEGCPFEFDQGDLVESRSRNGHFLSPHFDRVVVLKLWLGILGGGAIGWDRQHDGRVFRITVGSGRGLIAKDDLLQTLNARGVQSLWWLACREGYRRKASPIGRQTCRTHRVLELGEIQVRTAHRKSNRRSGRDQRRFRHR